MEKVTQEQMRKQKYILRNVAGAYYLLDVSQDGFHYKPPLEINEIGAAIWRLHEEGVPPELIAKQLAEKYETPPDLILEDVGEFLRSVSEKGFIT